MEPDCISHKDSRPSRGSPAIPRVSPEPDPEPYRIAASRGFTMGAFLPYSELKERLAAERAAGRKVVVANGHFDLLHVGHLRYLRAARAEGDVLVVALNGDPSVASLKGAGRPIVPAAERAELLAALDPVDYVTVFEGDSPAPLLADLQPDVHCKGTDYGSPERVPEYGVVRAYGGRTALVGDPKDHATSELIQKIKALP